MSRSSHTRRASRKDREPRVLEKLPIAQRAVRDSRRGYKPAWAKSRLHWEFWP